MNEPQQLLGPLGQEILGIKVCADKKAPPPPTMDEVMDKVTETCSEVFRDFVVGYRVSGRGLWRDRTAGWPIADLQKFIVGMSKPPWWRFVARWRWNKLRKFFRTATAEEIVAEYERRRKA